MTRNPVFNPIDEEARDGACHLLEAGDLTLHCGKWDDGCWVYSSGQPIDRSIKRYARRLAPAVALERTA